VRGGGVVEPDQLLAVDALLQDREVAAHGVDVERRMRGRHGWACAARISAALAVEKAVRRELRTMRLDARCEA
jgi:hypothetical protein